MLHSELAGVLAAALCPSTAGVLRGWSPASVVFDAGDGQVCTVLLRGGELRVLTKAIARPDSTVRAELITFRTMAAGQLSGIDAFVSRRLTVRGNLALAMQLQSAVRVVGGPVRFPRFGVVGEAGRRTQYLEAGPPGGSPVVLLHGLGATSASMLPLVSGLAEGYRVIVPDLPGFGASDAWRARYDAPFFAGWLDGLLTELGVGRAVVAGNSLGGRIALEFALRYPIGCAGWWGLRRRWRFASCASWCRWRRWPGRSWRSPRCRSRAG